MGSLCQSRETGASLELRRPAGVATVGMQDQDENGLSHGKDFEVGIFSSHWLKTRVGAGASVLCFETLRNTVYTIAS